MSDRKLMDFSFDVRREPEFKLGEALINGGLKLLEWLALGILTLGIGLIIWQIIDGLFFGEDGCGCDHTIDDYY